jgi:DNA-binding MarR family transcriptional regulator
VLHECDHEDDRGVAKNIARPRLNPNRPEASAAGDQMTGDESAIQAVETELALLLRRAEATRRADLGADHSTLDRAAYVILRQLDTNDDSHVGALADVLGLDGSTVTRQVAAMERDGLVERRRDPADGRGTLISATTQGRTSLRTVRQARAELYEHVLAGWSSVDRATLAACLHRLNESLDAHARSK